MTPLDLLVTNHRWALQCWSDRDGRGVWALVGPVPDHLDLIRDVSDGDDNERVSLGEYFDDAGNWLPAVIGGTLEAAVAALNQKLAAVPEHELRRGSKWSDAVFRGFERVTQIGPGNLCLNDDAREDDALRCPQIA